MVKDEYTLVLVKPDGVKTRHIGDIITRIERKGYNIEALKMIDPSEEKLRQHYFDKVDKPFFPELLEYMTEGPIVGIVVSGTNVIQAIHNMAGATNPGEAEWGKITGDLTAQIDLNDKLNKLEQNSTLMTIRSWI